MNDWVTIATFTYPHEVTILQGRLEAEGIECNIKDANTVSVNPFYSNAIGGVKIQVRENDVTRANEIVRDYFTNNVPVEFEPQEEYKPDETEESSADEIKCPVCGSTDVHEDKTPSYLSMILGFLLYIPPPLIFKGRKKYHCFNCGQNFKVR